MNVQGSWELLLEFLDSIESIVWEREIYMQLLNHKLAAQLFSWEQICEESSGRLIAVTCPLVSTLVLLLHSLRPLTLTYWAAWLLAEIVLYFNSRKMSQTNRSRMMQNVYNHLPAYGYGQASVPVNKIYPLPNFTIYFLCKNLMEWGYFCWTCYICECCWKQSWILVQQEQLIVHQL